jgi:hypothetical protein
MKVNEIINEGPKWDAFKRGVSTVGTAIGKGVGTVAGAGRAAVSAYNQGASAIATGYDAAAAKVGGSPSFKKTAGTAATLQRYRADWEQFSQGYQQGGRDLSDMAALAPVLDKYVERKYGVTPSKYPEITLASTRSKDVANYIYSLNIRAHADDQVNPPEADTQLQTGVAFPINTSNSPTTSFTDNNGHTYTYTFPARGSTDPGVWSYNSKPITRPVDIQVLNKLYLNDQRAKAAAAAAGSNSSSTLLGPNGKPLTTSTP